jgi:hypothetical protein
VTWLSTKFKNELSHERDLFACSLIEIGLCCVLGRIQLVCKINGLEFVVFWGIFEYCRCSCSQEVNERW